MKQIEATVQRPFFSVCYQWKNNPYTLFGCNTFPKTGSPIRNGYRGPTMQGTDDFELAKSVADRLVQHPGISYASVTKSVDCYNHPLVYEVKSDEATKPLPVR